MTFVLYAASSLAFLGGVSIFLVSKSAIHEIEAGVLLLVATILYVGAIVTSRLNAIAKCHDSMLLAIKGLESIGLADWNKKIIEKKSRENRAPGGTCPGCGSTNTESSTISGKLYGVRCHDCLQSFRP